MNIRKQAQIIQKLINKIVENRPVDDILHNLLLDTIKGMSKTFIISSLENRRSYLALDLRNIRDLLLDEFSPKIDVKNTEWHKNKDRENNNVWRIDRLFYIITNALPPNMYIPEQTQSEIEGLCDSHQKQLKKLEDYVHISTEKYEEESKVFDDLCTKCLSIFIELLELISTTKEQFEDFLISAEKELLCGKSEIIISQISIPHAHLKDIQIDDLRILNIKNSYIEFEGSGLAGVEVYLGGKGGDPVDVSLPIIISFDADIYNRKKITNTDIIHLDESSWNS